MSALQIALGYIARGWNPVPVPFRSKRPLDDAWQLRVIDDSTAAKFFGNRPQNVGVLLGPTSQGLTDVDLDCREAIEVAPYLLPPTKAIFGRASKRASHWLYSTDLAASAGKATLNFDDPVSKARLVEIRTGGGGKGAQTVFPGSVHEEGEPINWEEDGEPAAVDGKDLQRRVQQVAAACLIVRAWPAEGSRHDTARTLGSFLARASLSEAEVVTMVEGIARAAGDEEWRDRVRAARDAVTHLAATDQGGGLPKLAEIVGEKPARKIAEWLGYVERRWSFNGYVASQDAPRGADSAARAMPPAAEQYVRGAPERPPWPELAENALHGLAGELVTAVSPHTESDPVALLLQFLTYFGNAVGRGPYFQIEGDKHFTNLFVILVGESSKARKGTSAGRIRQFFKIADEEWERGRIEGGISSGEGLIWAVRDPIWKMKKGERELEDEGIADKRLLVDEREFFNALSVMKREGSTVSRIVRDAYDGHEILASLTKHSPARATNALISIVGHITEDELRQHLDHTSMANGYANRYLFACVRRARFLPHGGALDDEVVQALATKIARALNQARKIQRLIRTDDATLAWEAVYRDLSEGQPGLLGAIIGRAEAQTTRLSLLYALLDGAKEIDVAHLKAALAVWSYCEASALHIFGDTVGDPVADAILRALRTARPDGLTRNDLTNLFSRNRSSAEIGMALSTLLTAGKIRCERKPTGGRDAEFWFAV
jgi:hypothetical protein